MQRKLDHIKLEKAPEVLPFTSPHSGGPPPHIFERNRLRHGNKLLTEINQVFESIRQERAQSEGKRKGGYLEFVSEPGYEIPLESLEEMRSKKIRLLNVREQKASNNEDDNPVMLATVYVDQDKEAYFLRKIEKYLDENKDRTPDTPSNKALVNNIAEIRSISLVEALWQDPIALIPTEQSQWCEVWLRIDNESEESIAQTINNFEALLLEANINVENRTLKFLERAIKVVYINRAQLEALVKLSDDIAELRLATEAATFWSELDNADQAEWVNDLSERLNLINSETAICILDTGVNNGHPLLSPVLNDNDCHSVDPAWGVYDHDSHGTLMAGIATYGNLEQHLTSRLSIPLTHRLESVKILPPRVQGMNQVHFWGHITQQAVYRAQIEAPNRKRIVCMAVTSSEARKRGRPSSWSSAIDQLIVNHESQKLFIISAGNSESLMNAAQQYPNHQVTDEIHDPGQSWNALTVGAYTDLTQITDPEYAAYNALAPRGGLSPFTTTSMNWEKHWPIKPEVVMEGGNLGINNDGSFFTECADLSKLSTYYDLANKHFEYFNMTSLASAQLSWFAAQIQNKYPNFWPETLRALIVHSAEWTDALKQQFLLGSTKAHYKQLLRMCGYGVPRLETALYSASNSLTLISEKTIQPFDKKKTKEMHLYDLPWPTEILQSLEPQTIVEMRITLSYFIEPEPGERGVDKGRYRYASHFLRFDLKSPSENKEEFVRRINTAMRQEEDGRPNTESASTHWLLGSQVRDKGSIHSDIWKGTAAQLADSNIIAIIPGIGWWRECKHLNKTQSLTRYSLIVSISTPEETIDIYTPVATKIRMNIPVEIHV